MKKKLKIGMLFTVIIFLSSCEKYNICGCTYNATGLAVEAQLMQADLEINKMKKLVTNYKIF